MAPLCVLVPSLPRHLKTYASSQVRSRVAQVRQQLKVHEHGFREQLDRDAAALELSLTQLEH